jgi:hypothetical protein
MLRTKLVRVYEGIRDFEASALVFEPTTAIDFGRHRFDHLALSPVAKVEPYEEAAVGGWRGKSIGVPYLIHSHLTMLAGLSVALARIRSACEVPHAMPAA